MNFLGGILADLRERRLLPVAAALALALIAIPVLLLNSPDAGSDVGTSAATSTPSAGEDPPLVALASLKTASTLNTFDSKNPFDSPQTVPELQAPGELAVPPAPGGSSSGDGGSGDSGGVLSGGGGGGEDAGDGFGAPPDSPIVPPMSPPAGDDDGQADDDDRGDDDSGGDDSGGDDDQTVTRTVYTHEVDLSFGSPGDVRRIREVPRLALLPNREGPLLVFLGVNASATKTVFLVDARLTQSGEGRCRDAACSFIELGVGNVHAFTDLDGTRYLVRVDQIRKVEVRAGASEFPRGLGEAARARAGESADADEQRETDETGALVRRFLSPLFGDVVEEEVQQ